MPGMGTLKQDLVIPQGATFKFVYQLAGDVPASIAGFTARMQIRPWRTSDELYADWSTEDGDISINNSTKQIVVNVDEALTGVLDFNYGEYDLEMAGDNTVWRVAEGIATLSREVTR